MNPLTTVLSNISDEISGVGYSLGNQKGAFFEADDSKQRIEYFVVAESFFLLWVAVLFDSGVCLVFNFWCGN